MKPDWNNLKAHKKKISFDVAVIAICMVFDIRNPNYSPSSSLRFMWPSLSSKFGGGSPEDD
jgi:hypothetical protein